LLFLFTAAAQAMCPFQWTL